jgi:hypothetical protein
MSGCHKHGTAILLRGGREVAVGGELVDLVRTETETIARSRDSRQIRDLVFCWNDETGLPLWVAQVRKESAIPTVGAKGNEIEHPSGCKIVVPSSIIDIVELAPFEFVVCWNARTADEDNVAFFDERCDLVWTIGSPPDQPRCAYYNLSLQTTGRLEAYAKGRGFASVVDQTTGAVTETFLSH